MSRLCTLAFAILCLAPSVAPALEFKNIKPRYGAPLGALREKPKCMPGDVLFVTYDIEGLKFDPKTGKANYETTLELIEDSTKKVIFANASPNEVTPQLGGTRMPGDLHIIMGRDHKPGKYTIRLTVKDKLANDTKAFVVPFDLLPPEFGMVGVIAPAIGFPGQQYQANFNLVNLKLDEKTKMPSVDIMMRVMDEKGEKPVAPPIYSELPKDLPDEIDLVKENFVPMLYPIYLNRAGNYTIEVHAEDKLAKKRILLKYPLKVIDIP